jgi:hypothetical protein
MASTIALMLASLVSLSASQAPPPPGPPAGTIDSSPFSSSDSPPPIREGLDLRADYLLWWLNKGNVPPLVTTSAPADRGVLGAASTQTLFGGSDIGPNPFSGGRFSASIYVSPVWDAEVGGFFLTERRNGFSAQSDLGGPLLAIPTINSTTGQNSSVVIADPGVNTGAVAARLVTELWGLHAVGVAHLAGGKNWHVSLSTGLRYADFTESVRLGEMMQSPFPGQFAGAVTPAYSIERGFDRFHVRNQFIGALIGASGEFSLGDFIFTARAQVSGGVTHEQVNIHGVAFLSRPGVATTGVLTNILAQPTNIGGHAGNRGAFLPEGGVTIGYQLTHNIRLCAGGDIFYWAKVVRPGDQIDRRVNPDLVPFLTSASPTVAAQTLRPVWTNLWAQGVTCGLLLSY